MHHVLMKSLAVLQLSADF